MKNLSILNKLAVAALVSWAALLGVGCGSSFQAATPPGFVELNDQEKYDYRATTADGVVIAVRSIEHDPKGELDFWVTAIEKQVRENKGYALLERRDVKTARGLTGKQLRFGHDEGRQPHLYYVTIFATDARLYLVEAGGSKANVTSRAPQIDWAIQQFQAN